MSANAIALIGLATQALTQAMSYQLTVAKAQAEGRDVSDAELLLARSETAQLITTLQNQPSGSLPKGSLT